VNTAAKLPYFVQVEEPLTTGQESAFFGAVMSEQAVRTTEATIAAKTKRRRRIIVVLLEMS
jgi:hypothetical protein